MKRLITACQDLNPKQKSLLRSLLDQNVVGVDSMVTSDGTLISIPELLLVIADNNTNSKEGKYYCLAVQPIYLSFLSYLVVQ